MRRDSAPPETSGFESEIPPTSLCLVCSRVDCDGCRPLVRRRIELAWEAAQGFWPSRLWSTARQSVEAEGPWIDTSHATSLPGALLFALLAELLAVGSFFLLAFGVWRLLAFGLFGMTQAVFSATSWWFGLGLAVVVFMVVVHGVWGIALEVLVAWEGRGFRLAAGLGFALYACGWDLVTSPLGWLLMVLESGPRIGTGRVQNAARVPRAALRHYLVEVRRVVPERAARVALLSFFAPLLFTAVCVLGLFWIAMIELAYPG